MRSARTPHFAARDPGQIPARPPLRRQSSTSVARRRASASALADPNSAIAWKDGLLQFNSADITTVMHTVERYYDVDIQFDQGMSGKLFTGGFAREDKLEKVLKVITSFYKLQYKMDGKSVTVTH